MHLRNTLIVLIGALLLPGCTTTLVTSDHPDALGLRYYLPESVISFETLQTTTQSTTLKVKPDEKVLSNVSGGALVNACIQTSSSTRHDVTLNKVTDIIVPDQSRVYAIDVKPGALSGGHLEINRSDTGLLQSVDLQTTGHADDIAKTALSAVGTVMGIKGILDLPTSTQANLNVPVTSSTQIKTQESAPKEQYCKERLYDVAHSKGLSVQQDDYLSTLVTLLTDHQALNAQADIVQSQTSMKLLKAQIAKSEEELAKLSKPTETQSQKFKAIMATIEATEKRIAQHVRRVEAARAAIAARRAIVMAAFDVGVKKTEIAVSTAIAVSEIPNSKLIECWFKPNCNYNDMAGAPVAIENTLAEFKRLGFAISLDQLSTPPIAMDVPPEKNLTPRGRRKAHSNRSTLSKTQYVAYRDKEPFMRAFYKMSHPKVQPDSTPFSPVKREFKNLFTQRSPVGKVPYRVSSVGDRGMTLTFSNSGALISLKSTYTSSAKELGEAINQGLSQGLTNYKAAATTISEVNKLKREEELAEVAHKVSLLEKEKEVLEAHNNLGIAQMNTDDALRIAQINQELAVLAKEQELLQAQVNADVAGVTRPLTAEEQVLVAQQSLLLKQATLPLTTQTQILAAQDALKLAEATSPLAYETELIKAQLALLQQQQSLTPSGHQAELEKLNKLVENLITQVELLRQEKKVEDLKSEIDALQP